MTLILKNYNRFIICKSLILPTSVELYSLAQCPLLNVSSYLACVTNDIRFILYNRDNRHRTQNNDVSIPGTNVNTFDG